MVVRAARDDAEAILLQRLSERLGVLDGLRCVLLELRAQCLAERDGLRRDDVHERAALDAREDGLVELLAELCILAEDHAAARAAQRLVRRRRDDVGVRDRARVKASGDEAGDVRNVDHEVGTDLVGDLCEAREVDDARVGGCAGDNHLRLAFLSLLLERVVVDALRLLVDTVRHDLEVLAAHVDRAAVRQVTAVREVHAHDRVARRQECEEDGHVGLCAGMRLDVGVFRAEELLGAVDGELLDDIDVLAAAVVALARVAFGILIRQHAALRFHHGLGDDVLRGDELEFRALAIELEVEFFRDFRVRLFQGGHQAHGVPPILLLSGSMTYLWMTIGRELTSARLP